MQAGMVVSQHLSTLDAGDSAWTQSARCVGPSQLTTLHNLNACSEALSQGRFTWHHDSVLNCFL